MSDEYIIDTSGYLFNTYAVIEAAKLLRDNIGSETEDFSVRRLELAAEDQDEISKIYQTFSFSYLDSKRPAERFERERIAEDSIASVLSEVQVANVLIAAGQVTGEIDQRAKPEVLDRAIEQLTTATNTIGRSMNAPLSKGTVPGRFGFAGAAVPREKAGHADLKAFESTSNKVLSSLVSEAQDAIKVVINDLSCRDSTRVLGAISNLGSQIQSLPKVGRLIKRGIEKLESAAGTLIKLLGSAPLIQIKDEVKNIWKQVNEAQILKRAFKIDEAEACVQKKLASPNLNISNLDKACDELADLEIKFKESMELLKGITSGLGSIASLASFILKPIELFMVSIDVLILAGIILYVRDYTDFGDLIQRVRGVGEITRSL